RVRLLEPTARGHAVCLIAEPLRQHLGKVLQDGDPQQVGMNPRYAVGAVTSDHGEVGHAHLPHWFLLDETHAPDAIALFWVTTPDVVEEAAIDLIDDLQMARYQHLEQLDRPLLQRLWEQGVVRICKGAYGEIPGLLPAALSLIEQDAHQFG